MARSMAEAFRDKMEALDEERPRYQITYECGEHGPVDEVLAEVDEDGHLNIIVGFMTQEQAMNFAEWIQSTFSEHSAGDPVDL